MLLTLAATMVGLLLDPRVITGAPAWLKPAKFAVSISIYCFTLLWLLTFVRGRPRLVRLVVWATAGALGMEMVIIAAQVVRGTTSHFNVATPLDSALWDAMAFFVVMVLPLIGFLLTSFGPGWLHPGHRTALVWTTALSYLGLVVLLILQALRGQPLIAPDAATLGALLALAAVAGTAASAVMLHARRTIQKEKSS